MSIPALKLKIINERFVDLCRSVGKKSNLSEEDLNAIFDLEKADFRQVRPSSIRFSAEEGRPIMIKEKGPIIEVLGDNQIGKTTVLLYLANMLGYDFFNEDNIEFLGDENLVEQGQTIFSKLADGMKASLEINAKPYKLSISADEGWIKVSVTEGPKKISFQPFEVKAMSTAFMNAVKPYISVKFISKGRNFDRQLLIDICSEMSVYVEKFHERASNLANVLRTTTEDVMRKVSVADGVDFNARKSEIQSELGILRERHNTTSGDSAQIKLKIEAIEKLMAQLPDVEETKAFKLYRDIHQLQANLERLRRRLEILGEAREKQKEADKQAKGLREEIETLEKQFKNENEVLQSIETQVNDAVSHIESGIEKFLDESEVYRILRTLRNHEFDVVAEERNAAETDAGRAIEDLYKTAKKWNPSIKITNELGGTIEALQVNLETARKIILDRILLKTMTDQLFKVLEENSVTSYEKFETLKNNVQILSGKLTMIRASLKGITDEKSDSKERGEKELLEKTKREIENTQEKLQNLARRREEVQQESKETLTELERIAVSLQDNEPGLIIYAPNWTDELFSLKEKLNQQTQEKENELEALQSQIDGLEQENQSIINILSSPEFESLSKRRDSLDKFMGIMQTLSRVLSNWSCLTNQKGLNEDLISLSRHDVESELNAVINETFEDNCENYFRMIDEKDFNAESIVDFDYEKRVFTCDSQKQNIGSLSGGTASVMTVLSLASRTASSQFGTILLVDEFNDVAGILKTETYRRLVQKDNLGFAFFASPLDKSPLRTRSVEIEV